MDDLENANPFETKSKINTSFGGSDLENINPFETKSKINTSFGDTDLSNVNPFETKSKINTSFGATEAHLKKENELAKPNLNLDLELVAENNDVSDNLVSPVDLPNLEEVTCPESITISNNEVLSECSVKETNQTDYEQKDSFSMGSIEKPTSIDLNKSRSPRRKISTPDFEEEERLMMMEDQTPNKNNADFKSTHFKLDWNSPSLNLEDKSIKASDNQLDVMEHETFNKESIKAIPDQQQVSNKPLIASSPSEKSSPSVFSPLPSSILTKLQQTKNDNDMHVHWDEYNSSKDNETIQAELSTSKKDDFVRMELHYQATLLEKDKVLHDKEKEIQNLDQEVTMVKLEMEKLEFNNKGMLKVVSEYEKTISEVIADRERERVCDQITKEKLRQEKDQMLDDLHSAERAFNDVHR